MRGFNEFLTKKEQSRLLVLLVTVAALLASSIPQFLAAPWFEEDCHCLKVLFLDVGQGDAILVQTPDGHRALIDGGPDTTVLKRLGEELPFFDRNIDLVVATHPDADHIGGLTYVLKRYKVTTMLETTNGKDTPVVEALQRAIDETSVPVEYAEAGRVVDMGDGVTFNILSPKGDETNWESNTASIVMKVQYGSTSVMLTGDAPSEIEHALVERYGSGLKSDVLKLGHHGSKTSSSDEWLDAVAPTYAVVSAGIGNRYGHPHQEVMQRVFKRNIQTSHTGTDGTVEFQSDGKTIWQK